MASSRWTDEILDEFARSVAYAVRVTVDQLSFIVDKYKNTIPAGFAGSHEDALLEAGLMHVRAFDDFFRPGMGGAPGRPPDLRATYWVPKWQSGMWLDPRVRSQIDWKVIHLSSLSGMDFPPWNLAKIGSALCDEIERFFEAVEDEAPARLPALDFNGARAAAKAGAAIFNSHV